MRTLSMCVAAAAVAGCMAIPAMGASATVAKSSQESGQAALGKVVSEEAAGFTPQVRDGSVWAIAQTGDTMVVGGNFKKVRASQSGSSDVSRSNVFSFDANSGEIQALAPSTDGRVDAVLPGKVPGTVYVAGYFKNLGGKSGRVFLLDAQTGQVLNTFTPTAIDGPITDLALVDNRLFVGGFFTHVGGVPHAGIASLNADTGALDPYVNIQLQDHHNWTPTNGWTMGTTGALAIDASPDGSTIAIVGNFKTVDGQDLDQAFLMDTTGPSAQIVDWQTNEFDPQCSRSFDTWVRDVKWSPDGEHFSIVTTGAPYPGTLCDSVSTWKNSDRGQGRRPAFTDHTGGDSLYSVSHTDSAVYVGGHERWANNPNGRDSIAAGAVPRPGMGAMDHRSLEPIDWNPGRNPRGYGVTAMYATEAGLWIGSDTEYLGNREVFRPRLAFFPAEGGREVAPGKTQGMPAYLYQVKNDGIDRHFTDGATFEAAEAYPSADLSPTTVRGAFVIDDTLYYGASDGYLYRRDFAKGEMGSASKVDPYNDPKWSTVPTGSGNSLYGGRVPQLYGQFASQVSGLEVKENKIFYTRPGSGTLSYTGFSPDSAIIEPFYPTNGVGSTVPGTLQSPGDFVFINDTIVYVNSSNGNLMSAPFSLTGIGASVVLDSSRDYRGRALFLGSGPKAIPNELPTAAFAATCTLMSCELDATESSDPDGSVVTYDWDFGDGATDTGVTAAYEYTVPGKYTVSLTVTDERGGQDSITHEVEVREESIEYVGTSSVNKNLITADLDLPGGVRAGDTLVLTVGAPVSITGINLSGLGTWEEVGRHDKSSLSMGAYSTIVGAADLGMKLKVTMPAWGKTDLQLHAYRGPAAGLDVTAFRGDAWFNPTSLATPTVTVSGPGAWALHAWYTRSATVSTITPAAGVSVRGSLTSSGSGRITSLTADSAGAIPAGEQQSLTAMPDAVPPLGGAFTLLLVPRN